MEVVRGGDMFSVSVFFCEEGLVIIFEEAVAVEEYFCGLAGFAYETAEGLVDFLDSWDLVDFFESFFCLGAEFYLLFYFGALDGVELREGWADDDDVGDGAA